MNNNVAQASAIIMKMVYDDKFVQMLDQMLSQTKGGKGTENGIAYAVGVVATQIVQTIAELETITNTLTDKQGQLVNHSM